MSFVLKVSIVFYRLFFSIALVCFASPLWAEACSAAFKALERNPVSVTHVYDGDTFKLGNGQRLRLIGVNAPELGRDGKPDEPHARAATDFVRHWFKDRALYLSLDAEHKDRYRRTLGHITDADGASLSVAMLEAGLAWPVAVPPNTRMAPCEFAAAKRAAARGLGVWSVEPLAAKRLKNGGFTRVSGVVSRVSRARNGDLWLDLGSDLAVQIRVQDQRHFEVLPDSDWLNRELTLLGWAVDRRGDKQIMAKGYAPFRLQWRHPLMGDLSAQ